MRLSSHGPRARAEFRRLVLQSQIGATEAELALRRSRQQRLRARRVERRLTELRALLGEVDGRPAARRRQLPRSPLYFVSALWLAGALLLGVEVMRHGLDTMAAAVGDIVMLVLSLVWFGLAVAQIPLSAVEPPGAAPHPETHE